MIKHILYQVLILGLASSQVFNCVYATNLWWLILFVHLLHGLFANDRYDNDRQYKARANTHPKSYWIISNTTDYIILFFLATLGLWGQATIWFIYLCGIMNMQTKLKIYNEK